MKVRILRETIAEEAEKVRQKLFPLPYEGSLETQSFNLKQIKDALTKTLLHHDNNEWDRFKAQLVWDDFLRNLNGKI